MAPIKRAIKIDHYDMVIEDFERLYTKALFLSTKEGEIAIKPATFNIMGQKVDLNISVNLSSNGRLEVRVMRSQQEESGKLFKICLGGKVRLLECDSYSSFEAVKFCGYRTTVTVTGTVTRVFTMSCVCGVYKTKSTQEASPDNPYRYPCRFEGANAVMRQYLRVGNDIPEKTTIRLELEFLPSDYEPETLQDDHDDCTSDLMRGMAALRKNPKADIKLICNEKQFTAHKAVLSARSDVFAALFSHKGTKEDESGEVHIEDCDHEAMEMFLSYIYEGAAPPAEAPFGVAKQLVNIANKYNVQSLKKKGGKILLGHLNEDNALQMALLGELYNMDALKKAAKNLIASSEKSLGDMIKESGFRLQDGDNGTEIRPAKRQK